MRISSAYGHGNVVELSDEKLRAICPSIYAESRSHEKTSERYEFIPTSKVLEGLKGEGWFPVLAHETNVRHGGENHAKHMVRFRNQRDITDDWGYGSSIIGELIPEIVLVNAHNGTSSFQLHAGIFRVVCANGMIVSDSTIQNHKIRHTGNAVNDVIEAVYSIVEETPKAIEKIADYKAILLNDNEKEILAQVALGLRWNDPDGDIPFRPSQLLQPRRYNDNQDDLWSVFNRIQENMLRGGMRGFKRDNKGYRRRTTARAIKSVSEDVRLNKSLWALTEKFAELKNSQHV